MKNSSFLKLVLLCCLLTAVLWVSTMDEAQAQTADQKLAQQSGLGSKKIDADKLPGKLEYTIAIGSVVAMIAVVKFA
ncbi:MAG TPA: hypothetical protein PLZ53_05325 [Candidatus Hydrogenedentes bacterium]|jgi:hypothetical protein|nr:MAG: hypothetical protein BWY07_00850 [Candidatus Hydrogenedentes bacterium ADurb.Bin170]HNZ49594.1 hypothetical protein [Candidatus Hydrogenedentota bacterium]HOD95710.1 hypothetical protein [Candidatus Hydrogenedentota bacterium]HOH42516.1 hypothetical protein [Candidatus Hydrogenedentota bacterium]HOM47725.1 hypothetical protein [Candidatus Hydrogenedentota bacterium]